MKNKLLTIWICFFTFVVANAQQKETTPTKKETATLDSISSKTALSYNPLSPAKAAFYSALLPGLGQAYNKKYWKIPIIYGALGTGVYFYINNTNQYNRYRNAFKRRLNGFKDDEFYGTDASGQPLNAPNVSLNGLQEAQEFYKRNQELSLLITIGIYALNIIEANVNAHLLQFNVDDNLSFRPHYKINEFDKSGSAGLTLNFNF